MTSPTPLDPEGGPTSWVWTDGDGLIHLATGMDPTDPAAEVALNREELQAAMEEAGVIQTHV